MVQINKNIKQLKPSATLAINQKVGELRSKGENVCHFGFGQSPFPIHSSIVNALRDNADNNHYLPTVGLDTLRKTIANFLKTHQKINVSSEYVYIGPGSKELLYQTILILDGTFLIPKGSWVSYGPQINSKNGKFEILETHLEHNFKLEASALQEYCEANSSEQKILILNSPNNPTGAVYSNNELEELAKVCKKYDIIVLSDEIYSQINFNDNFSPSISTFYPEKTIVFGGLSKVFSAGGYRLGFMILPKDLQFLQNTYRSLFSETFSAVSSPIQFAAIEAYKMSNEVKMYVKNCAQILKGVSNFVYERLEEAGIDCTSPQGAFYMMIGFNKFKDKINSLGINTSEELSNHILEQCNVSLLPASDFYFKDEVLFFRLAFVDFDGSEAMKAFEVNYSVDEYFVKKHCPNIYNGVKRIIELTESF
jgi:aspartate aminotransferase